MPVKIFFCYAHEDETLLNKLKAQLMPLQREGLIDVWHDRDIDAGAIWEHEINKHLDAAQIILLLVSPDFMASDYINYVEMKRALERDTLGEARVIPVILRPVYWQGLLGKLQALPTDGKPVNGPGWHNLDEALFNVATGIREAVAKLTPSPAIQATIISPQVQIQNIQLTTPELLDQTRISEAFSRLQKKDRGKFDRFNELAKNVIIFAIEEVNQLQDNALATEHLLLGLIREERSVAAQVLSRAGAQLDAIRQAIEHLRKHGETPPRRVIALTQRANKALERAASEAYHSGLSYISPEHLLLGLLNGDKNIAIRALELTQIDIKWVKTELY